MLKNKRYLNYFKNDTFRTLQFVIVKKTPFGPHFGHPEPQKTIKQRYFNDFTFAKQTNNKKNNHT